MDGVGGSRLIEVGRNIGGSDVASLHVPHIYSVPRVKMVGQLDRCPGMSLLYFN